MPRRASETAGRLLRVGRAVAGRAFEAVAVALLLASLVFLALRCLPGDPARLVLGDEASESDLARVRATLHLDEPLSTQYVRFVRGLFTVDLGDSFRRPGTPAMARVAEALLPTAQLAGLAVALGAVFGIGAGLLAAGPWLTPRGRRWIERGLLAIAATPLVAFAPLMTFWLSVRARLVPLPGDPDAGAIGLLFASVLLAIPLGAHLGRVAHASLCDVARAPFLTVACAKGGGSLRVWLVHALPAASAPMIAVVATQLGALLGGAVVLERLFERWGLGTLILEAYASRDLPVLEGAVVASALLFVVAQTLGTAIHAALDPRAGQGPSG